MGGAGLAGRTRAVWFWACLTITAVALGVGLVSALGTEAEAEAAAGNVAPVQATYHGVKPYDTISVGTLEYDAWTYGDIVFYSPPGMVTQDMANQWLAWYATTDDILRTLIGDDEHFEGRFRRNDRNFGKVKVIGTPPDSCGAGCGNKQIAEGVGIIDKMVAEPNNYDHHWILFYEQARGGVDESFDLAASWPREAYHLPHLIAALTYYEIGGIDGVQRGVPGDIYNGLQKWADLDRQYVDQFVEREQRWFDDQHPDGSYIYPPQTSMLLHIGLDEGYDTLAQALRNLGQYPDNFMYSSSTDAMCDWQAAINDATGNRYADRMVNEWGMPGGCTYDIGQSSSSADHPNDLRFEASGLCIEPDYKPNSGLLGHYPCDGSADQQFSIVNDRDDGTFSVALGADGGCLDASGRRLVVWSCHGADNQMWQWNGDQLQQPDSDLCITANIGARWGGGLLSLESCADSPAQRINTNGPTVLEVPPVTPLPEEPVEPPTTEAPAPTTPEVSEQAAPEATEPPHAGTPTTASEPPETVDQPETSPSPPQTVPPATVKPPTPIDPPISTGPTPEADPTPETDAEAAPGGTFALVNVGSGKCVDQPWSLLDGGNVIQWRCAGHTASNQLFNATEGDGGFTLQFVHSNRCLDEWRGDFYQFACHAGEFQLFSWNGAQLQAQGSGMCVTVVEASLDNGAEVRPEPCVNSPAQQFTLERYGNLLPSG